MAIWTKENKPETFFSGSNTASKGQCCCAHVLIEFVAEVFIEFVAQMC